MTPDGKPLRGYSIAMRKNTALALAALMLVSTASAQVSRAPADPVSPIKVKPTCVCDQPNFKPLTDKAVAVEAYWTARRKTKIAAVVGGTGVLLSLLFQSQNGMRESTESYDRARSEMWAAKAKAESLGALKVTGDDLDGEIEIKLEKGVDYTL